MKKLIVVFLAFVMLLLTAGVSEGTVHNLKGDFFPYSDFREIIMGINVAKNDLQWFTIKPGSPYLTGAIDYSEDTQNYGVYYFQNDQMFAELHDFVSGPYSTYCLRGSYLFDFGLFAGINRYQYSDGGDQTYLSAGYRYNLDDQSYIAASLDQDLDHSATAIDLDGVYFLDRMKVSGQLFLPDDEDLILDLGVNYQLNDSLVCGVKLNNVYDNLGYLLGLTWSKDNLVLNGKTGNDAFFDETFLGAGVCYQATKELNIGADVTSYEGNSDPVLAFKVKYVTPGVNICFNYLVNNFGTP